jgi:outer membrane protein assembly factor BamB
VSPDTTITTPDGAGLHQLWQVTLPVRADGSPVVVSGVSTPGGKRNLVVVTTVAGDLVAVDASTNAIVWAAHHPAGSCRINNGGTTCYTTSSPTVDPDGTHVYTYGLDGP